MDFCVPVSNPENSDASEGCGNPLQEAALAAARQALDNARERAPVRPSYGEFVFQSR